MPPLWRKVFLSRLAPDIWEAEAGGSLRDQGQAGLDSNFYDSKIYKVQHPFKTEKEKKGRKEGKKEGRQREVKNVYI